MSDDLKQVLRAAADRSDSTLLHMTAARMRAAADRIDEQEKMIAELERERDAWKNVVNLAEREIGMLSCAVDPSSSCLVDYCAELSDERTDVLDELADLRDCKEHLRKLGAFCGCDHVENPDDRAQQRKHLEEWISGIDERCRVLGRGLDVLRALLETAVNAWDRGEIAVDVGHLWHNAVLSRAWRDAARKVLEGKDGGA